MQLVTQKDLDAYPDGLKARIDAYDGEHLVCHRWLAESKAKRYVYEALYGDLLKSTGKRILDVGGGVTGFTAELGKRHDYTLVDPLVHGGSVRCINAWPGDWAEYSLVRAHDVVIANDLFPNVDQRLSMFLKHIVSNAREIRLSLTFFPTTKWYRARRVGGEEIMTMLAWGWPQTASALEPYRVRGLDEYARVHGVRYGIDPDERPVFENGRHVVLATVDGAA